MDRIRGLDRWLACHEPADSTESGHLRSIRDLLAASGDVFSRDHFHPGHLTASGIVLPPDEDTLLLVHHIRLQCWLQPGGHIDPTDADLAAAARREVTEETGLHELDPPTGEPRPFDVDVHRIPANASAPAHLHFDVRFLFRSRSKKLTPSSDVNEAQWVPFAAVGSANSESSMTRLIRKLDTLLASTEGRAFRGES